MDPKSLGPSRVIAELGRDAERGHKGAFEVHLVEHLVVHAAGRLGWRLEWAPQPRWLCEKRFASVLLRILHAGLYRTALLLRTAANNLVSVYVPVSKG